MTAALHAEHIDDRMTGQPALHFDGVVKRFDAVVAVNEVTCSVKAGQIMGLVGENGAGKSTLIALATGAEHTDAGSIRIGDVRHHYMTPQIARRFGIAAIRQEPVLVPTMTVAENLLLGRERGRFGLIDRSRNRQLAQKWLAQVDAEIPLSATPSRLSPADRQLIDAARAVGPGARVLFFDEPTAALGPAEVDRLYRLIRRLAAAGTAVVYVSHRPEEIFEICERVVVLRDGHLVADEPIQQLDENRLVSLMAGRTLTAELTAARGARRASVEPILSLRGISVIGRVHGVDLDVFPGEIHGIAGVVGSGRSELVEAMAGVHRPSAGTMTLGGRPYSPRGPADALRRGVALVPEDRLRDAIFPHLTVATNTLAPRLSSIAKAGFITAGMEAAEAAPLLARLSVRPQRSSAYLHQLSGGNQQKVVLARALGTQATVLLLDEPTRGIDVASKAEIHKLTRELAASGIAIVLVSSDLRELIALADRVTVLARGRHAGTFKAPLQGERLMAAATGAAA